MGINVPIAYDMWPRRVVHEAGHWHQALVHMAIWELHLSSMCYDISNKLLTP